MNRELVIELLSNNKARLAEFGVASLRLFGSVGRNRAGPASDVDLIVSFEGAATFDRYMGLKMFLEDLLGSRIDLVTDGALRPELRPAIEQEAIRVA